MKDDDRRLSGAYAADAVTDEERAAHEELMREDPELAEETESLVDAVSELSKISEQSPPAYLRDDVLNAIKSVRPLPPLADDETPQRPVDEQVQSVDPETAAAPRASAGPQDVPDPSEGVDRGGAVDPSEAAGTVDLGRRRARRRGAWMGAIAAAAAALVAVVVILGQRDGTPTNQAEAVISASDVTSQTANVDDWTATLYLSQVQEKAVISSEQMPDAPEGKDFQVWLMHDDEAITSAGVMPRTHGEGQEYVVNGVSGQVTAIAISEEPAGGSPGPTTDPFIVVDLA
ncbi:anti-sigma factor domain-containing protein [Cumulibacter soli]|uniref:anti-sigma factor domain-containing protein n=1 Tax=Cumulibacter soli TaxID=2546344 RepID=UPI0010672AF7|nr:anti-sigma factor [Cumulibacter soli]